MGRPARVELRYTTTVEGRKTHDVIATLDALYRADGWEVGNPGGVPPIGKGQFLYLAVLDYLERVLGNPDA